MVPRYGIDNLYVFGARPTTFKLLCTVMVPTLEEGYRNIRIRAKDNVYKDTGNDGYFLRSEIENNKFAFLRETWVKRGPDRSIQAV